LTVVGEPQLTLTFEEEPSWECRKAALALIDRTHYQGAGKSGGKIIVAYAELSAVKEIQPTFAPAWPVMAYV
jgi:hypothetical protein